jgi:hypothetical protein
LCYYWIVIPLSSHYLLIASLLLLRVSPTRQNVIRVGDRFPSFFRRLRVEIESRGGLVVSEIVDPVYACWVIEGLQGAGYRVDRGEEKK